MATIIKSKTNKNNILKKIKAQNSGIENVFNFF